MAVSLLLASNDETFREMIREQLLNIPDARVVGEFPEVNQNLYIRVLQEVERHPDVGLVLGISRREPVAARPQIRRRAPDSRSRWSTEGPASHSRDPGNTSTDRTWDNPCYRRGCSRPAACR